jgi:hypothetical protein
MKNEMEIVKFGQMVETKLEQLKAEIERIENYNPTEEQVLQHCQIVNEIAPVLKKSLQALCLIFAMDIGANENNINIFLDNCPAFDKTTIARMVLVGQGQIDEGLMFLHADVFKYVAKEAVPVQRQLLNNGVKMVAGDTFYNIPLNEMTRGEIRQAFSKNGLRTDAQQKSYLLQNTFDICTKQTVCEGPYRLIKSGGRVLVSFTKDFEMSRPQVKKLLNIMDELACPKN